MFCMLGSDTAQHTGSFALGVHPPQVHAVNFHTRACHSDGELHGARAERMDPLPFPQSRHAGLSQVSRQYTGSKSEKSKPGIAIPVVGSTTAQRTEAPGRLRPSRSSVRECGAASARTVAVNSPSSAPGASRSAPQRPTGISAHPVSLGAEIPIQLGRCDPTPPIPCFQPLPT